MKILFLADGKPEESLKELSEDCDLIVLLGDMMEEWIGELKEIMIPKIGVHGNHDKTDFSKFDIIDIHLKRVIINNVSFLGFDGDMGYIFAENNRSYNDIDIDKYKKELGKLEREKACDIFISHCPSEGTLDRADILGHKGLKSFSNYIISKKPKYHLHGHMHKSGNTKLNNTKIFCVYPYLYLNI